MKRITVHPQNLRQFGSAEGATFVLVTNPLFVEQLEVDHTAGYSNYVVIPFQRNDNFEEMLQTEVVPLDAHVLVISPDVFFQSPPEDALGKRRKLIAMACNSTPTDLGAIQHFLRIMENTDPEEQRIL